MIRYFRSLLTLIISLAALALPAQEVSSIIEKGKQSGAFWSVSVRDVEGNVLEEFNSDHFIIPASNQKLFTTAAILDGLGSDYQFQTNLYSAGSISDSILYGDLIIRGVGDPSISGFMYDNDREFVFRSLIQQLKDKGILKINGALVANIGYFDDQVFPKGWDWEDLSFYYGVEINPLSFNNNAVDLVVDAAGKVGEKPTISWFPDNTEYVTFYNRQTITSPDTKYDEDYLKYLGRNEIHLGSFLPQGYVEEESLAISEAHLFFLDSFEAYLQKSGISTNGFIDVQVENQEIQWEYEIVASHTSEPLSRLIEWTNKESDNFYTEMLLKTLAAEKRGIPGTFEHGIDEVRDFLGRLEIDTTYVFMKDGSGMASGNFTKTSILSEFLVEMQQHPEFEAFFNSMSIAGIDGTIAHRMKGTPLYKNFKGKSGYVGGVRTLSGYFETSSGETLIVSLAANNFIGKVRPIDAVHEEILMYLYGKY